MSQIVVLIDFSDASRAALHTAWAWCRLTHAQLHVFHQAELMLPGFTDEAFKNSMARETELQAEHDLHLLVQEELGDSLLPIRYHVSCDKLLPAFIRLHAAQHFRMAFMGGRPARGLADLILGNTAKNLLESVVMPLVLIPAGLRLQAPFHMLVALKPGIAPEMGGFLNLLQPLEQHLQSLKLLTVAGNEYHQDRARAFLEQAVASFSFVPQCSYEVIAGDDVAEALVQQLHQNPNSFLVVQQGGRGLDDLLFRNLLVHELLQDASVPLIVLP